MFQSTLSHAQPRFRPLAAVAAWLAAVLLSAPLLAGAAVTVHYTDVDLTDVVAGQDLRAYDYAIDGSFDADDVLTIEFPVAGFNQLALLSGPATLQAAPPVQPDPAPPGLGTSGLLMLTAPSALPAPFHDSLRVSFVSVGGGSPGAQPFDVVDAGFANVQPSSSTIAAAAVPEPAAGVLLAAGLALLAALRGARRPRARVCRVG